MNEQRFASPDALVAAFKASGATLAVLLLRAALACHTGMATFSEAGVATQAL